VTHYMPGMSFCDLKYRHLDINHAFYADAEHLVDNTKVKAWIYGHTHTSKRTFTNSGGVTICNPLGYSHENKTSNFNVFEMINV
jgi:hypothetical protein